MENLDLPLLRELYLHRNNITEIKNLSGCPRLRKLWLFQNKLTRISGLHALPELESCWLQANQITSLDGMDHCLQLSTIGLAGNPLSDIHELVKLAGCPALRDLSLSDIHFGRSAVVDMDGYREFVTLHLRQVWVLDGVRISPDAQATAEEAYLSQVRYRSHCTPVSVLNCAWFRNRYTRSTSRCAPSRTATCRTPGPWRSSIRYHAAAPAHFAPDD